jgi:hypothetical protein
MDADRNADSVEELRSNNARLLAALKGIIPWTRESEAGRMAPDYEAAIFEAQAAIDDAETRIANDIAEETM